MKRFLFIMMLITIGTLSCWAQQFMGIEFNDESGELWGPNKEDPTGWAFLVINAGSNGVIDKPQANGTPGGDDFYPINMVGWNQKIQNWGYKGTTYSNVFICSLTHVPAPAANLGDYIYVRCFNAEQPKQATMYNDGPIYQVPQSAGHYFQKLDGKWDGWKKLIQN